MSNELKFYEERLHERDLPNINGQYRKGARYSCQDWYGNKLVLDRPRTYFGEAFTAVKPDELTFNTKTIFDYVDNQVREFIKRLLIIVPDSNLELDKLQVFIQRNYGHPDIHNRTGSSVYVYEDDGNTKTEGFHYDIFWALPFSDRNRDLEYAVSNKYGNLCDAVVFKLEFNERIHDGEISFRYFSLYFNGIMTEEVHDKKIDTRIDCNNENMSINSIITLENLFRVGKKLIEYRQDEELLRKATLAFEQ